MEEKNENKQYKPALIVAGIGLALFVALDAIGAHALQNALKEEALFRLFSAATTHLSIASLGLIAFVILQKYFQISLKVSIYLQYVGLVLFCTNLLILFFVKLNGATLPIAGMLAPIGGFSFIASWLLFVWKCFTKIRKN
jgi:uncharacterized membrane protein YgdD (TMEM256/DUF423 family)